MSGITDPAKEQAAGPHRPQEPESIWQQEATMTTSLYLSGHDLIRIAHHAHWIPLGRGITRVFMDTNFPGWTFNSVFPNLVKAKVLKTRAGEFSPRHLPHGVIGLEISRTGSITLDDGSLESEAREFSWVRNGGDRVSEHLTTHNWVRNPVLLHLPYSSRHIPDCVANELIIPTSAAQRDLHTKVHTGLTTIARHIADSDMSTTVCQASLSPIVFDPLANSATDAIPMARANGDALRAPLSPERLFWYQHQYHLYISSINHLAQADSTTTPVVIVDLIAFLRRDRSQPAITISPDFRAHSIGFSKKLLTAASAKFSTEITSDLPPSTSPYARVSVKVARDLLSSKQGRNQLTQVLRKAIAAHNKSQRK